MILLSEEQEIYVLLALLIMTGTFRGVVTKVYVQLGFDDPFFLTVVNLFANTLAIPLYFLAVCAVKVDTADDQEVKDTLTKITSRKLGGDFETEEEDCSETESFKDFDDENESVEPTDLVEFKNSQGKSCSSLHLSSTSLPRVNEVDREAGFTNNEDEFDEEVSEAVCESEGDPEGTKVVRIQVVQGYSQQENRDPLNLRASFQRSGGFRSLRQVLVDDLLEAMVTETQWKPRLLEDFSESLAFNPQNSTSVRSFRSAFSRQQSSARLQVLSGTPDTDQDAGGVPSDDMLLSQTEGERGEHWARSIPKYARPFLGSCFRLLDTAFTMLAYLFLPASLCELAIRGLELIVSMLAQKFIRKKTVKPRRWFGAFIVSMGLTLVMCSDIVGGGKQAGSDDTNVLLGLIAVAAKACMGVSADMAGEIVMQETAFPPTLLIGMEGLYGLLMALPLYCIVGPLLGYFPADAFREAFSSLSSLGLLAVLVVLTASFWVVNIILVARISLVTVNMAASTRGLFVWIVAIIIFYASGNSDLGESWSMPGSPMLLAGFSILMSGVYVYSVKVDAHKALEKIKKTFTARTASTQES